MADYARNRDFLSANSLFMIGVAAYMSFSLFWHEPVPEKIKLPLSIILILFAQVIPAMRVTVTRKKNMPMALIRAGGFVSASFVILSWCVLIRDVCLAIALTCSWIFPSMEYSVQNIFSSALSSPVQGSMLAFSLGAAFLGMAKALSVPAVHRIRLSVPHLPKELEGLTIAHLSDLHVGSSFTGTWLEKVVQRTNALSPDFTFITGDLADGTPEYVGEALRPLTALRACKDVVISTGNHDYYSGLEPWLNTWEQWGLHILLNSCRHYTVRGKRVCVAAVTDRCAERFSHLPATMGPPDIQKALKGTEGSFVILLSHRPGQAAENAAAGCHLQLSGHTHNGQFFFLFPLVSFLNNGFRSGSYRVGGMALHVSPGTGMWSYIPMRIGTRSEITLLTLQNGGD